MRIVSLNAWGGQLWKGLSDWLGRVRADVLCLQEVTRAPVASPDWLRYVDPYRDLAQRADLFGDVCAALKTHQSSFAPAARGPLWDEAGVQYRSEHGIGTWVHRGLAVSERVAGFVHGRFRPDGWGKEPVPRTIQLMRIENGARSCLVSHMHGLRDPGGKGDTPARLAQAHAAIATINTLRRDGDAVVLMGDFNLLPDSACFDVFAQAGLHDLVRRQGIKDTRTHLYSKPGRHANYCLVTDNLPVKSFAAPPEPVVSDHRPLILDVGWKERN